MLQFDLSAKQTYYFPFLKESFVQLNYKRLKFCLFPHLQQVRQQNHNSGWSFKAQLQYKQLSKSFQYITLSQKTVTTYERNYVRHIIKENVLTVEIDKLFQSQLKRQMILNWLQNIYQAF